MGIYCGGLNKNALQDLIASLFERIRRCDLVEGNVSFGVGFEDSEVQARPRAYSVFLLPMNLIIELSGTCPAPGLLIYCHTSHHDDNQLNLWNFK